MHVGFRCAKPEGKGPLGKTRDRWEGNIRMDLREIGWDGMDWIHWLITGKSRGGLLIR
jgi:hypothetical protein